MEYRVECVAGRDGFVSAVVAAKGDDSNSTVGGGISILTGYPIPTGSVVKEYLSLLTTLSLSHFKTQNRFDCRTNEFYYY